MEEVPGSEKFFPAQLVFLALGFLGVAIGLGLLPEVTIVVLGKVGARFDQLHILRAHRLFRLSIYRRCRWVLSR